MSFRIWSVFCLDVFLKSTSPSSLYKPVDLLFIFADRGGWDGGWGEGWGGVGG